MSNTVVPELVGKSLSRLRPQIDWKAILLAHKRLLVLVASAGGLFLVIAASTVAISSQPGFCINCHEIRPAYDQWRTSAHSAVACIKCHAEPGPTGYIKVNTAGALNIVTHFLSDYRLPQQAAVHDASCLDCHPRESRPELSLSTTLRVAHSKHDQQQCADCHGRLVHVSPEGQVSTSPRDHEVRDCTVCHIPENCPHGDAMLACTSCHSGDIPKHEPAQVRGVMPRENCQECHKKNKVGSPNYCPTCHVSPHGVSLLCDRCHTTQVTWTEHTFNHPVQLVGNHSGLDCAKCHGTKSLGGLKYVCQNCHTPPAVHKGSADNCSQCHSEQGWKQVKMTGHRFPQDHNGAGGNCAVCHPQGNTKTVNCNSCHVKSALDSKHAAKGLTNIDGLCVTCHPSGKKP